MTRRLFALLAFALTALPARAGTEVKAVDLGEVELHYVEKGTGVPVIFVHGTTGSLYDWTDAVEIVGERYRAIAYSRRFNVPNTNPYRRPSSMLGQGVRDLDALATALGVERFHLVGLSWGGYVAALYAAQHPERLLSLTLAEPAYLTLLKDVPGGREHYDRVVEKMPQRLIDVFATGDETEAFRVFLETMSNQPIPQLDVNDPVIRQRLANVKDLRAAAEALEGFPHVRLDALAETTMPVLLMSGETTFVGYFNLILDVLQEALPRAERVVVPAAGHEMFAENPKESSRILMTFLRGH